MAAAASGVAHQRLQRCNKRLELRLGPLGSSAEARAWETGKFGPRIGAAHVNDPNGPNRTSGRRSSATAARCRQTPRMAVRPKAAVATAAGRVLARRARAAPFRVDPGLSDTPADWSGTRFEPLQRLSYFTLCISASTSFGDRLHLLRRQLTFDDVKCNREDASR